MLYRVVHPHLDALVAQADARYEFGCPAHTEKTYRAYLECGLLRAGASSNNDGDGADNPGAKRKRYRWATLLARAPPRAQPDLGSP